MESDEHCQGLAALLFCQGLLKAYIKPFRQVPKPPLVVIAVLRAEGSEVRLPGVPGEFDKRTDISLRLPKAPASPPELPSKRIGQAGAPCKLGQFKHGPFVG